MTSENGYGVTIYVAPIKDIMSQNSNTPVAFSPEESDAIGRQLGTEGKQPLCPLCGGQLTVRGPLAGGYCYIKCRPCGKSGLVTVTDDD